MVCAADKEVVRKVNAVIGSKFRRDDMLKTRSTALHKGASITSEVRGQSPDLARATAWQAEVRVNTRRLKGKPPFQYQHLPTIGCKDKIIALDTVRQDDDANSWSAHGEQNLAPNHIVISGNHRRSNVG